jgi:hypothetical protein
LWVLISKKERMHDLVIGFSSIAMNSGGSSSMKSTPLKRPRTAKAVQGSSVDSRRGVVSWHEPPDMVVSGGHFT